MTPDPDPLLDADLTALLGISFQVVLAEFVRRLDARGYPELRPLHGLVFQEIRRAGGLTATELAERLGVTKQATGQIVGDLEQRGYLSRQPHPNGGRWRLVVLTEKGLDHMFVAGRVLHELETELATAIDEENLATLRGELRKLVRAVVGDDIPPLRPTW